MSLLPGRQSPPDIASYSRSNGHPRGKQHLQCKGTSYEPSATTRITRARGSLGILETAVLDGADAVHVKRLGWSRRHPDHEFRHSQDPGGRRTIAAPRRQAAACAIDLEIPEHDFPLLLTKTADYVAWGIDGMIVKMPAVMALVHRHFPDMTIHASAGANVQTFDEMMAIKAAGASQFVLSASAHARRHPRHQGRMPTAPD